MGGVPTVRESQNQENGQLHGRGPVTVPAQKPDAGIKREIDGSVSASLLEALSGRDANRDRAVALRTRRVVMGSLGVLKEQKQDKSRARAIALAVTLILLLLIAPLLWEATDSLIAGEHFGDAGNQWSLWAVLVCPTLLGAAIIAGWWRRRS